MNRFFRPSAIMSEEYMQKEHDYIIMVLSNDGGKCHDVAKNYYEALRKVRLLMTPYAHSITIKDSDKAKEVGGGYQRWDRDPVYRGNDWREVDVSSVQTIGPIRELKEKGQYKDYLYKNCRPVYSETHEDAEHYWWRLADYMQCLVNDAEKYDRDRDRSTAVYFENILVLVISIAQLCDKIVLDGESPKLPFMKKGVQSAVKLNDIEAYLNENKESESSYTIEAKGVVLEAVASLRGVGTQKQRKYIKNADFEFKRAWDWIKITLNDMLKREPELSPKKSRA